MGDKKKIVVKLFSQFLSSQLRTEYQKSNQIELVKLWEFNGIICLVGATST